MINYIDNYEDQIRNLLLNQFSNSHKLIKLLKSFASQIQKIENAGENLDSMNLQGAEEGLLNNYGSIVGEDRLGRDDENYLIGIALKIILNKDVTTLPNIISALKILTESENIQVISHFPASLIFHIDGDTFIKYIGAVIRQLVSAGVGITALTYLENGLVPFGFEGDDGAEGFTCANDVDQDGVGQFVTII